MTVRRAERRVVDNVDLDVARGQIVSVSGPSGCGKSTLLRGLARLEPASGSVLLDGSDAAAIPFADYRRRVSLVFQESPMFEGTVADNIRFGPALRGESLDDERVRDLLRSLSLEPDMAVRDAHELSGGERQRVALARAIANDPDVLLLDEPTSALDPAATDEVLAQIARVAERGLSVVAVLHVEAQARVLSDTRYRMKSGRLELEAA